MEQMLNTSSNLLYQQVNLSDDLIETVYEMLSGGEVCLNYKIDRSSNLIYQKDNLSDDFIEIVYELRSGHNIICHIYYSCLRQSTGFFVAVCHVCQLTVNNDIVIVTIPANTKIHQLRLIL